MAILYLTVPEARLYYQLKVYKHTFVLAINKFNFEILYRINNTLEIWTADAAVVTEGISYF